MGNTINNDTVKNNTSTGTSNLPSNSAYEAGGLCDYVINGDTIDVEGVSRIRFVGVNRPERGDPGYQEAKNFVKKYGPG